MNLFMGINEILLACSVVVIYGSVLFFYRYFGRTGLCGLNAVVTIAANIEVLILVVAFGLEQTLGNVLFASTFLISDTLNETEGKRSARQCVYLGIAASLFFLVISQSWLLYAPSAHDFASPALTVIFSQTPRMIFAGLSVYAIVQLLDVWLYRAFWSLTKRLSGSEKRFLWFRNYGSVIISQLVNSILFNFAAFWRTYDTKTLISMMISTFLIYALTTLLEIPFLYITRWMHRKGQYNLFLKGKEQQNNAA